MFDNDLLAFIRKNREYVEKNPSNMVQLVQTMSSLMGEEHRSAANEAINLLNQLETLKRVNGQLNSCSETQAENDVQAHSTNCNCVHRDGVYEIDEQCLRRNSKPRHNMNNILLMMMMLKSI